MAWAEGDLDGSRPDVGVVSAAEKEPLSKRLLAELLGSAFLAATVVGSGIAAQHLSPGNVGLELFENAAVTAAVLYTFILMFGPVSGAHFNPVISFVDASLGGLRWRDTFAYVPAQVAGCIAGAMGANLMFSRALVSISTKHRATGAHFFSEVIATFGLVFVVFALSRTGRGHYVAAAVGAYIGAAYFFTSSASFANPATAVGRMFSNTFAGIAPSSGPSFVGAEILGGAIALGVVKLLYPRPGPLGESTGVRSVKRDSLVEGHGEPALQRADLAVNAGEVP